MLFVELRFLPFFLLVLVGAWALPGNGPRKAWLLGASYLFYASWDWRFLGLILASTVVDWIAGAKVHARRGDRAAQRRWLGLSLGVNLGILGFYKYFDFFVESANALAERLGVEVDLPLLRLILPVGISFYTFQTLSYTLDVYRGRLAPARSPLDLALFVAFFPQLVAGPIVLAKEFLPQLVERPRWSRVDVKGAAILFLLGFLKKSCLSDAVAPWVDAVHAAPGAVGTADAWLGACLFALQIYCDFSGYSDMAIATAALLGYQLPENFRAPYLTRSLTAFWTHWHVTLGRWFREYLYFPLGGSRRGTARTCVNLFVVFLVSGLWHGAAWTFVVWGAFHGAFVVAERLGLESPVRRFAVAGMLWVNVLWITSMVLFRAPALGGGLELWSAMFAGRSATESAPDVPSGAWVLLLAAFAVHYVWARLDLAGRWRELPGPVFGFTYGVAVALMLPWVSTDPAPYIYFAF